MKCDVKTDLCFKVDTITAVFHARQQASQYLKKHEKESVATMNPVTQDLGQVEVQEPMLNVEDIEEEVVLTMVAVGGM